MSNSIYLYQSVSLSPSSQSVPSSSSHSLLTFWSFSLLFRNISLSVPSTAFDTCSQTSGHECLGSRTVQFKNRFSEHKASWMTYCVSNYEHASHPSPPTILPSSLTPSCHLFLGLPLNLVVPKFIYNTPLGILFSSILCTCPNKRNLFELIVSVIVGILTFA